MSDLYYGNPINWSHPRNSGLISRWQVVRWWAGSYRFIDIAGIPFKSHLTLTNMDIPGTTSSGWGSTVRQGGQGELRFDGTNDRGNVSAAAPSPLNQSGSVSLLAWIKANSVAVGVKQIICNDTSVQYNMEINRTAAKVSCLANGGSLATTGNISLVANKWHRIGMTRTGSTGSWTYNIFVDGVLDISTGVAANPGTTGTLRVGSYDNTNHQFNGALDYLLVYNRALSASEFAQDFIDSQRIDDPTLSWIRERVYSFPVAAVTSGLLLRRRRTAG